jgi:prepilin-type N-terminal cleavage/methylation domain-containing protein
VRFFILELKNMLHNKHGFTLNEIVVTIVIIGVLATFALPRYSIVVEKTRAAEARQILASVLAAQKSYQVENSVYTNDFTKLDITVTPRNFLAPVALIPADATKPLATMQRNDATYNYTVGIKDDGTYTCNDGTTVGICLKLIGVPST